MSFDQPRRTDRVSCAADEAATASLRTNGPRVPPNPWYKSSSTIVSIAAVIVPTVISIVSLTISFRTQRVQSNEQLQSRFRELFAQITQVESDLASAASAGSVFDGALVAQKSILLAEAEAILVAIEGDATAEELVTLGYEFSRVGAYNKAYEVFLLALDRAGIDSLSRVVVLRNLGSLMLTPGHAFYNAERAREFWEQALGVMLGDEDSHSLRTHAYTLEYWFWAEKAAGNAEQAQLVRDRAVAAFTNLAKVPGYEYVASQDAERVNRVSLDQERDYAWARVSALVRSPVEFNVEGDEIYRLLLDFDMGATDRAPLVWGSVYFEDDLQESWKGEVSINSSNYSMQIQWSGQSLMLDDEDEFYTGRVFGELRLRLSEDSRSLEGLYSRVGFDTYEVVMDLEEP